MKLKFRMVNYASGKEGKCNFFVGAVARADGRGQDCLKPKMIKYSFIHNCKNKLSPATLQAKGNECRGDFLDGTAPF